MIKFVKCKTDEEDLELTQALENKIIELDEIYGSKSCNCHPEFKWEIAVDIYEHKKFEVHYVARIKKIKPCDFDNSIIEKINIKLKEEGKLRH